MALADPVRHERTLFILATLFAMYLRVSDLVGRPNWTPVMGDFRQDAEGNWWYHVIGKGNKAGKIAMRDEYIEQYLKRYRRFLGLPALPHWDEKTPLLSTLQGRSGLSGRQVRALLQAVFDNALARMRDEGRQAHEMNSLKAASAHWLRHNTAWRAWHQAVIRILPEPYSPFTRRHSILSPSTLHYQPFTRDQWATSPFGCSAS